MRDDRDEVKELLKSRIEDLCARLLPDGRRQGRLWVSYNPVTNDFDRSTPELKVALTMDVGAWKDWRSGDKGDVLKLIEYVKGHTSFRDTMAWARDFLGLSSMPAAERERLNADARRMKRQRDDSAERKRLFKIFKAEEKFLSGEAFGGRSVAELHARRYFAGRKCALEDVPNIDTATFRFAGESEYWTRAEYRHAVGGPRYKIKDGPKFPAIHSAMRAPGGLVTACHVTFLDPVIPKKISLEDANAKLIFGEAKGSVIRISHGPENVPPEVGKEEHPLIVCEGIETGLSLAIACPSARVWAAGSLSNMGNVPVFLDCIPSVIVARDNNHGNRQAEAQLEGVLEQLASHGKPMTVIASHVGDDFNDLAQGEE